MDRQGPCCTQSRLQNVQIVLREVIDEILPVVGSYCDFVCRVLILLIQDDLGRVAFENVTVSDAPEFETEPMIQFFVHPPKDLKKYPQLLSLKTRLPPANARVCATFPSVLQKPDRLQQT
jgi:hypothetical protein